ncbi:MAG: energy transducer TonB [Marinoscillum sp.]
MKKHVIICTIGLLLAFVPGCETKSEKSEKTEVSVTPMTKAERFAKVEKERKLLAEQRAAALTELIATKKYYESDNGKQVYYKAETDPSYVGGDKAMNEFLKKNLKFPVDAEKEEHEGTVFVDFIVAEGGEVTEVIASSYTYAEVDELFTEEALRVVNLMPDWTPGRQNGKAVNVKYSVPITFLIQ